jgi:hypothetical protein
MLSTLGAADLWRKNMPSLLHPMTRTVFCLL